MGGGASWEHGSQVIRCNYACIELGQNSVRGWFYYGMALAVLWVNNCRSRGNSSKGDVHIGTVRLIALSVSSLRSREDSSMEVISLGTAGLVASLVCSLRSRGNSSIGVMPLGTAGAFGVDPSACDGGVAGGVAQNIDESTTSTGLMVEAHRCDLSVGLVRCVSTNAR